MYSGRYPKTYHVSLRAVTIQLGRLMLFLFLAGLAQLAPAQQAGTLEVTGSQVTGRSFTLGDLATLPQAEVTETRNVGTSQQQESTLVQYRGVLLRDVVEAAGYHEKERRDFRRSLVVATARDGYVALFTWGELFNTKLGNSVLVVTAVDGKPLSDAEGPYALRALGDIKPGPRHVKWLQKIDIRQVAP